MATVLATDVDIFDLVAVSRTTNTPEAVETWEGFAWADVDPSPKSQSRLSGFPGTDEVKDTTVLTL